MANNDNHISTTKRTMSCSTLAAALLACAGAAAAGVCDEWVGFPTLAANEGAPTVWAIIEYEGDIVIGGNFEEAGGVPTLGVARWDNMSWQPMGGGMAWVRDLVVYEGHLIAVAPFSIARWDEADGSWVPMIDGWTQADVHALAVHDGSLYVGDAGGVHRWDGSLTPPGAGTWTQIGNMNGTVRALHSYDGDLIAGGSFTAPFDRAARWDGNGWHDLGAGPGGTVNDFITFQGKLIAAMQSMIDGSSVHQWNGLNWAPVGVGASSQARALAIYAGDLIKASSTAPGVQRFDGDAWHDINGTASWNTWSLLVQGSRLIAGRGTTPQVQFYEDCAGACCFHGACFSLNFDQCAAVGGFFHGTATTCGDAECDGPEPDTCPADLTGDGNVGVADLLQLLSQWGPCP